MSKIKEFLIKNKEIFQLVYGVILVIIIPIIIVVNTLFVINKYSTTIDTSLQRRALLLGRVFYASVKDNLDDIEFIQRQIDKVKQIDSSILDLKYLVPEQDQYKIAAASSKEEIGEENDFYLYHLAWQQPDKDGIVTDSHQLSSTSLKEGKAFSEEERFWLAAMPFSDYKNKKVGLLSMRVSSQIVDDLVVYNRNASIIILTLSVLFIILFLSTAVRLWDYALLYRKIKEVDKMKDEFISIASHELRTPLTAIRGYVEMMQTGTLGKVSAKSKKALTVISISADRLGDLVEDLLNVSRIEQGRLEMTIKPAQISQIINEIIEQLKVQAEEKGLYLKYEVAKDLPKVLTDTDKLKQILVNLIGNAVKYTKKGGVTVTSYVNKDGIMEIKVADTGIGMSPKEKERLFEKFYRVKGEQTKNIPGTGLGLWITKKLIELMKGKIYVESLEGVGTQTIFTLPIEKK
ncbi:HAMP domain-containing histidine kinase [Patescibacteria group bacterium]|nr:HAMP domain-containing histidine kinase [Patescibacteria group bacterium]MBU4512252.1 HAMP domain-containing histidine kinase [Patescibacteria group bacterium]MCG2692929.1 HAMP domain-containing histidine kinase [Candidatus Parcubacteria bacterium]